MKTTYAKKDITIDGVDYKQIRKDVNGKPKEYMNKPKNIQENVCASGLHIIDDKPHHYDHYIGKEKIGMEPTEEKPSMSIIMDINKGIFMPPKGKILILTGKNGKPTYISPENYVQEKEKYRVVLSNKKGFPVVLALL